MKITNRIIIAAAAFAMLIMNPSAFAQTNVRPDEMVLTINGVVCPACAQGIIRKVSKLDFIDTTKLNSGVELDVENHKARMALKPGAKPDLKALFGAIRKGGFDPVDVTLLQSGKVVSKNAAQVNAE